MWTRTLRRIDRACVGSCMAGVVDLAAGRPVSGVLAVLSFGNAPGWSGYDPDGLTTRGTTSGTSWLHRSRDGTRSGTCRSHRPATTIRPRGPRSSRCIRC